MPRTLSLPRPVLLLLALLFAAATTLYTALWLYAVSHPPAARLGIETGYSAAERAIVVSRVHAGGAADLAGLQPDDRIRGVNARPLLTRDPFDDAVTRGRPGDRVELAIERPGAPASLSLTAILRASPHPAARTTTESIASALRNSYPLWFLVIGLAVLFLRLHDPYAWLLALLFACFIVGPPPFLERLPPGGRAFAGFYSVTFFSLLPAVFYLFFALFPNRSPLERRWPRLKWVLLAVAALAILPARFLLLTSQRGGRLASLADALGPRALEQFATVIAAAIIVLGIASLAGNAGRRARSEVRRKVRIILWGAVLGLTPIVLDRLAHAFFGYEAPFWLGAATVVAVLLFPLSIAYAVVRHRVLEIPILLKRSARYLIVRRGFALLVVLLSLLTSWRIASAASETFAGEPGAAATVGVLLGAALGILLAVSVTQVGERVTRRIDRAFFRSAYDTRQILEDLAGKTRSATSRQEISLLLEHHAREALQPVWLAAYFNHGDGRFVSHNPAASPAPPVLPASLPLLSQFSATGVPLDVPPADDADDALALFGSAHPECLVPLQGRDTQLEGVLVLGPRLSEEPYSADDKRLLASVSSQVGVALENIRLAEQMASRFEAEHRLQRDLDIARQVQEKLFPQKHPPLATLEYAGACIQARAVGGDYYDFLDFSEGRLGLVLADIAGKGIYAALLMANLQANLRSQYALALKDLAHLICTVNRLFLESTQPHHYATFFFGLYEDAGRRLRYVNCGHNPPVILRAGGTVDRLGATATVLGLFEDWSCTVGETSLQSGDTLVVFSDGATEAFSDDGVEFGDARLIEAVRAHAALPPAELLATLARTVAEFSGREQEDDLTLLVARAV